MRGWDRLLTVEMLSYPIASISGSRYEKYNGDVVMTSIVTVTSIYSECKRKFYVE